MGSYQPSFHEAGPQLIQKCQQVLTELIPMAPRDSVWGCTKSIIASFAVTLYYTHGKILPPFKAAGFASLASCVHLVVAALFGKVIVHYQLTEHEYDVVSYASTVSSLTALFIACLSGRKKGIDLGLTLLVTGIPYILIPSKRDSYLSTPLFQIFVC